MFRYYLSHLETFPVVPYFEDFWGSRTHRGRVRVPVDTGWYEVMSEAETEKGN